MRKLDWETSAHAYYASHGNAFNYEELGLGGPISFPTGYVVWAETDIDECQAEITVFGYGDTEEVAYENLREHIKRFTEMLNG